MFPADVEAACVSSRMMSRRKLNTPPPPQPFAVQNVETRAFHFPEAQRKRGKYASVDTIKDHVSKLKQKGYEYNLCGGSYSCSVGGLSEAVRKWERESVEKRMHARF